MKATTCSASALLRHFVASDQLCGVRHKPTAPPNSRSVQHFASLFSVSIKQTMKSICPYTVTAKCKVRRWAVWMFNACAWRVEVWLDECCWSCRCGNLPLVPLGSELQACHLCSASPKSSHPLPLCVTCPGGDAGWLCLHDSGMTAEVLLFVFAAGRGLKQRLSVIMQKCGSSVFNEVCCISRNWQLCLLPEKKGGGLGLT